MRTDNYEIDNALGPIDGEQDGEPQKLYRRAL